MNSVLDWHRKNNPYLYETHQWYLFLDTLWSCNILTASENDIIYGKIADELEPK
jgi:hypothetical protein